VSTHEVTNQPPALPEYNVVLADPALREGIARWGREQDYPELEALGALAGSAETQIWGDQADRPRASGSTKSTFTPPGTS
jgi:putative acyl-CoA dehydrogenase